MNVIPLGHLLPFCPRHLDAELRRQIVRKIELDLKAERKARQQPVLPIIHDDTLESVKRAHVQRVVATSETLGEAAVRLDVNPVTLYRMNIRRRERAKEHEQEHVG